MTDQTQSVWTTIIAAIVIVVLLGFFINQSPSNEDVEKLIKDEIAKIEIPSLPTAEDVAALIPEAPVIDTTTQDRICELTEGCEYWEGSIGWLNELDTDDAEDDFLDELASLVNIDEDYLEYDYDYRDNQVRAYSDDDRDDDNWEIQVFIKVEYWDIDDVDEDEVVYLLITSVLDEGEYDNLSIEEVSRTFEFA